MLIIGLYSFLIILFIVGLIRLPKTEIDTKKPQQKFSIVVPFRNEENALNALLQSIQNLNYNANAFEILLIDDDSTDNSINIIKKWQTKIPNLKLFNNIRISNSPKKDAIKVGVKASKHDYIITTDADCELPKNWLHAYNSTIHSHKSLFVAGPIALKTTNSFVEQYQKYDSLSLIGATMGSFGIQQPIMCNAANMGFHKNTYLQIQKNNTKIASGDDVFTLEYFVKNYPKKVQYLNNVEALVQTNAEKNWKNVFEQRIRWAAKTTHYQNLFTKFVGFIILLTQLGILIALVINPLLALFMCIVKFGIDFILIWIAAEKINQNTSYFQYLLMAILYPFLNVYIGIRALFGGYTWKDRKFKR